MRTYVFDNKKSSPPSPSWNKFWRTKFSPSPYITFRPGTGKINIPFPCRGNVCPGDFIRLVLAVLFASRIASWSKRSRARGRKWLSAWSPTCASCKRLLKCGLASFIIFFFLSFLIVKYSDKFDRFEMKIWKWKSNDDANVVKYVTNRRAVSSNGELCFVDFWASQRLLED